jgi:transposase-like protein
MPKFNLAKKRGKAKIKIQDKRRAAMERIVDAHSKDFDVRISIIQELIPLGLKAVADELQGEVQRLAGEKHSRGRENVRWGSQNGSVYLRDEKIPVNVPRVRNLIENKEVPLKTYQRLQTPFKEDGDIMRRLLHGLSTHKYHESSALAAEAFGISASSLSKRFKRCSTDKLKALQNRSLAGYDCVAIFIDGKRYAKDGIMVALGVTLEGRKLVLGIEQVHSENSTAIGQWLERLIERGLKFEQGILFIIDGAKGIRTAIKQKFGPYALVQRCRWHKRENVVSYLKDADKVIFRRRLQAAYNKTTHKDASRALEQIHLDLQQINLSAANSLTEGIDETLTIHELGLSVELARSLSTTNCIEGFMSQIAAYTDKVDRWRNSSQIQRWTATSALDIEPRLHRIRGHRFLKVLRFKLSEVVNKRIGKGTPQETHELVGAH